MQHPLDALIPALFRRGWEFDREKIVLTYGFEALGLTDPKRQLAFFGRDANVEDSKLT